jgi:hypothetical protein
MNSAKLKKWKNPVEKSNIIKILNNRKNYITLTMKRKGVFNQISISYDMRDNIKVSKRKKKRLQKQPK